MIPRVHLRVGGVPVETVADFGDVEVVHGRHGPLEASWSMALRRGQRPWFLKRNARVEVYWGTRIVFSGILAEPDWDGQRFTAIGTARLAEGAQCLTSARAVTSKPNTAIDAAITRGVLPWVRDSDFGNTDIAGAEGAAGVDDPDIDSIEALLNLWAIENNSQWRVNPGVDKDRLIIAPEDEKVADWLILPGAATLGVADDQVTDAVFLRYDDSASGQLRTASYPSSTPAGGVERKASIVHHGAMTSTRATTIATGMWRKLSEGRTGWTNGIEAFPGQVITPGGLDANLALIRGGDTVQLLDAPDPRGVGRTLNVVLDEVRWTPEQQTAQLNPVGLVPATWEHVLEQANAKDDR